MFSSKTNKIIKINILINSNLYPIIHTKYYQQKKINFRNKIWN